ncbi:MAG: cysteine peptidase family C39 domain-containing protein, partial [Proteobacteria bacterium]|nr:cysteine peptidase family C39 domain-containing protein [Pseudomonadota bacterium]
MHQLSWFRRVPCLRQSEAAECGVVCLAMVAGYFGRWIDLIEFRQSNRVSLRGTDLRTLLDVARDFGVSCRALRGEPEDLASLRLPAILHWNLSHFVVLTSVKRRHVILHDPALGRVRVAMSEVSRAFSGIILECSPDTRVPAGSHLRRRTGRLSLTSVIASIQGHGWSLTGLFTITLLLQICVLVAPLQVQWVIDEALVRADVDLLTILLLGFLLVLAVRAASEAVSSWLTTGISAHLTLKLGEGLFDHLVRLPLRWFENRHIGDIVSRFGSLQPLRETL